MKRGREALRAAMVACSLAWAGVSAATAADDASMHQASADAHDAARWIAASHDAIGRPYALVDKKHARLLVFAADGRLAGSTPALLGLAPGDHALPGTGSKPLSQITFEERTTPAGRFASEPGRNLSGEHVVWFDYEAGLAIHRLRPGRSEAARLRSLATATPADNRASLGCVVVPAAFYESVIGPLLGRGRGVVYVLPETQPVEAFIAAQQLAAQ